jgi:hypothetical protein
VRCAGYSTGTLATKTCGCKALVRFEATITKAQAEGSVQSRVRVLKE